MSLYTTTTTEFGVNVGGAFKVVKLDDSHVFVLWIEGGSGTSVWRVQAIVGLILGNTITFGAPITILNEASLSIDVAGLDASHVVVAYNKYATGEIWRGNAVVCAIDGTTITLGAVVQFAGTDHADSFSVASPDSTHGFVAYRSVEAGGTIHNYAIICSVAGLTPTFGTALAFAPDGEGAAGISTTALDSTHALIAYNDGLASPNKFKAVACTISGTIPTFGSSVTWENGYLLSTIRSTRISSSQVFICYTNYPIGFPTTSILKAVIAEVSGTVVTFGSSFQIGEAAWWQFTGLTKLTGETILIVREANTQRPGTKGEMLECRVMGTTINARAPVAFWVGRVGDVATTLYTTIDGKVRFVVVHGRGTDVGSGLPGATLGFFMPVRYQTIL